MINQINEDIKQAMINKNILIKDVLKSVKNTAIQIAKENKTEVNDEIVIKAIKKELKQLDQTIVALKGYEDTTLYKDSINKKEYIQKYLPKEMSDEELTVEIKKVLSTLSSDANFGLKMKAVMKELKNKADGNKIKNIINSL